MNFEVETAKNGENTLKLNKKYIYSKYNPSKDAEKFIATEIDNKAKGFLLVGLGLGYHLDAILKLCPLKNVVILLLDSSELEVFEKFALNKHIKNNVKIINRHSVDEAIMDYQIIVPNAWLKAISVNHPFFNVLEDIKIRQMSYKSFAQLLDQNFHRNITNEDYNSTALKDIFKGLPACLVAAGPSLNDTINRLQYIKGKLFILCVGSALKVLLKNGIIPDAVIITDPSPKVIYQIEHSGYAGLLFYLSSANHTITKIHKGLKIILFQEGYKPAEEYAGLNGSYLFETGGSVATTGLSLIDFLGFKEVYLFGQDLGFIGKKTHSTYSTSGIDVASKMRFRKVLSNNGELINSTSNLSAFHRWIERKATETKMRIFNTAKHGAKIANVPYIDVDTLVKSLGDLPVFEYGQIMENTLKNNKGEMNER